MAPGQQARRCAVSHRAGNDGAQCRTACVCRRGRRDDRTGGAEPAAAACLPILVGAGDPACPGRGSVAPPRPGIAGTSSRAVARDARARGGDRRGSDPDPAPAARPSEYERLLLRSAASKSIARSPSRISSFRYGPIEIETSERANRLEAFHAGQVYSITRRPAKEKAARKRLADFDFVEARAAFPTLDHRHARDLTLKEPYDWFDFLNLHAAELQAQGFEIRVDDDFPYRLATSSGDFDAEFEFERHRLVRTGARCRNRRRAARSCADAGRTGRDARFHAGPDQGSSPKRAIISICRWPTAAIFRLPPIASCHWCWRCMACG